MQGPTQSAGIEFRVGPASLLHGLIFHEGDDAMKFLAVGPKPLQRSFSQLPARDGPRSKPVGKLGDGCEVEVFVAPGPTHDGGEVVGISSIGRRPSLVPRQQRIEHGGGKECFGKFDSIAASIEHLAMLDDGFDHHRSFLRGEGNPCQAFGLGNRVGGDVGWRW